MSVVEWGYSNAKAYMQGIGGEICYQKSPTGNRQGFWVVRGRIELPTHGFSVHCSTN